MQVVKAFLRGAFEVAFCYRGYLICVTDDHRILAVSMQALVDRAAGPEAADRLLLDMSFAHNGVLANDWLAGLAEHGLLRPLSERAFPPAREYEFDSSLLDSASVHEMPASVGFALDCDVYWNELYVATTAGLYRASFRIDDESRFWWDGGDRGHDGPTYTVDARGGAVSIACGDDGLLCELSWRRRWNEIQGLPGEPRDVMSFDEVCSGDVVNGDWMRYDLLAIDGECRLALIRNDVEEVEPGQYEGLPGRYKGTYVSQLGVDQLAWWDASRALGGTGAPPTSGFADGLSIYLSVPGLGMVELRPRTARFSDWCDFEVRNRYPVEAVLGGQVVGGLGLLLDVESGTVLIHDGMVTAVDTEPNVSLRGFPRSRSYPRMVAAVKEDHLALLAFWPDAEPSRVE